MYANINDASSRFKANETILDVARRNGIHIPTLCELHGSTTRRAPAAFVWSKCMPATTRRYVT